MAFGAMAQDSISGVDALTYKRRLLDYAFMPNFGKEGYERLFNLRPQTVCSISAIPAGAAPPQRYQYHAAGMRA